MKETMKEFEARMMTASVSTLVSVSVYLRMAFSQEEYEEKTQKLEILKRVVAARGLDK